MMEDSMWVLFHGGKSEDGIFERTPLGEYDSKVEAVGALLDKFARLEEEGRNPVRVGGDAIWTPDRNVWFYQVVERD